MYPHDLDDGTNSSDPEIIEWEGKTYLYYIAADQLTWSDVKRAEFDGTLDEFFAAWFPEGGIPERATLTADRARQERRDRWFSEAKFGLFVHWGLYTAHEGAGYDGEPCFALRDGRTPAAEYEKLADEFNPRAFDARQWARMAKAAGMRYIVFTSKHHEGFSMFDSELSAYTSAKRAAGRDFVREWIEAAPRGRTQDRRLLLVHGLAPRGLRERDGEIRERVHVRTGGRTLHELRPH